MQNHWFFPLSLQLQFVQVSWKCYGNPHNPLPPRPPSPHAHTHTMTYKQIHIHIWSVFVPILQSWKLRHSEDAPGTLYSKQASQRRCCSVIINTMTVWVYTKCRSGKRLLSGETASLFLRLARSFTWFTDDNAPVGVWLSVAGTRALWWIRERNWVNICCIYGSFLDELPRKSCERKNDIQWHSRLLMSHFPAFLRQHSLTHFYASSVSPGWCIHWCAL